MVRTSIFQTRSISWLKWMGQYTQKDVHNDFADRAKNMNMKSVIKGGKSVNIY